MIRRSLPFVLLIFGPLGCAESPSLGPPPENFTSPIQTTAQPNDEQGDDANEEGASADTNDAPGCDPFADPEQECGSGMDCDPDQQICVMANGTLALGEPCDIEGVGDECSPGLICNEGRCRQPCDPAADLDNPDALGACPSTDVCALVGDAWGVCLASCSLVAQDCETEGEGCNRAQGVSGVVAACSRKTGGATDAEPCASDGDCLSGLLCTPQSEHAIECGQMAASCCTFVCDADELPCFGVEPSCYVLGIDDQPSAGYCGGAEP